MAAKTGIARRRDAAIAEAGPGYVQKRNEVVKAAAVLFKQKGYEATSLGDIADAVGVDRASLYYYFESKHHILQDAIGTINADNLAMIRQLRQSELGDADKITELIRNALVSFDANYPQVFVYIQEDMTRLGKRRDQWARSMLQQTEAFEAGMLDLLRDGIANGSFRADLDPELVAQGLWGMINWTHRWYRPDIHSPDVVAATFSAVFLGGVDAAGQAGRC